MADEEQRGVRVPGLPAGVDSSRELTIEPIAGPQKRYLGNRFTGRQLLLLIAVVVGLTSAVIVGAIVLARKEEAAASKYVPSIAGSGQHPPTDANGGRFQAPDPTYVQKLNLPPRLQWNENYGYCGSTSMICAGLYYGEYVSQYDNRNIASNGTNQKSESSQLLLGVNDFFAATQHKMTNLLWNYGDTNVEHFFVWIKSHILQGHPVIIGIYENSSVFGNNPPDPDYDHIVPVYGWGSNHPLTDPGYYADDVIYFSDNGLYTPDGTDPIYYISAAIGDFAQSRHDADKSSAAVYSVNGDPTTADPNYGIALTGIVDIHNDCLPTRIDTNKNYESPEIVDGSNTRPTPMPMVLTVTVSGLTAGTAYNVYQYNSLANVPSSQFNSNSANAFAATAFTATEATYSFTVDIVSSDFAIFRTVLASAP
jgi:hypothetical protein